jgi:hypothetical protein
MNEHPRWVTPSQDKEQGHDLTSGVRLAQREREDTGRKYTQQRIVIVESTCSISVAAMVAQGSGLAYHYAIDIQDRDAYHLTHMASGGRMDGAVDTPEQAQRWLEAIVSLLDWTQAIGLLRPFLTAQLRHAIEVARQEALKAETRRE